MTHHPRDFTAQPIGLGEILDWARERDPAERFRYVNNGDCAQARFLRDKGYAREPGCDCSGWRDRASEGYPHLHPWAFSREADRVCFSLTSTMGQLVAAIEAWLVANPAD